MQNRNVINSWYPTFINCTVNCNERVLLFIDLWKPSFLFHSQAVYRKKYLKKYLSSHYPLSIISSSSLWLGYCFVSVAWGIYFLNRAFPPRGYFGFVEWLFFCASCFVPGISSLPECSISSFVFFSLTVLLSSLSLLLFVCLFVCFAQERILLWLLQFMQEQGISLDEVDQQGNSAVHVAAQHGHLGCIQVGIRGLLRGVQPLRPDLSSFHPAYLCWCQCLASRGLFFSAKDVVE